MLHLSFNSPINTVKSTLTSLTFTNPHTNTPQDINVHKKCEKPPILSVFKFKILKVIRESYSIGIKFI